jgi:hypothetical protein
VLFGPSVPTTTATTSIAVATITKTPVVPYACSAWAMMKLPKMEVNRLQL